MDDRMYYIWINGRVVRPKSLKVTIDSLADENSGRTRDGVMHINYIYNKIRKLEIELPPFKADDRSYMEVLSLVQGHEYTIQYYDPIDRDEVVRRFYTSNSSADVYSGVLYGGVWQGVKFNAIEVAGENDNVYIPNNITISDDYRAAATMSGNYLIISTNGTETYSIENDELLVDDVDSNKYYINNNNLYRKDE